jgi:hypothetical protein
MKIEIYKNKKKLNKINKVKLFKPNIIEVDFSSIKELKGNKLILDSVFQNLKKEYHG